MSSGWIWAVDFFFVLTEFLRVVCKQTVFFRLSFDALQFYLHLL
jgi:hypothetical protein